MVGNRSEVAIEGGDDCAGERSHELVLLSADVGGTSHPGR